MDTRSIVAHARGALQLGADDEVVVLGVLELPDPQVGLAAAADSAEPLLMLVESQPFFRPHTLAPPEPSAASELSFGLTPPATAQLLADLPLSIVSWETSAHVVVCEASPPATLLPRLGAVFPWRAGALVLHLGAGPLLVELQGTERELVLAGEPGRGGRGSRMVLLEVRRKTTTVTAAQDMPSALLEGLHAEPWLSEHVHRLELRGTLTHRAAAAGLVARLWIPHHPDDRELVRQGDGAAARARRLVASFSADEVGSLLDDALGWVHRLTQSMAALQRTAVSAPQDVPRLSHAWIAERDDLESVHWALTVHARQAPLTNALAELDQHASSCASVFAFAPELGDDDRVLAVHWQEPGQWWGAFAET